MSENMITTVAGIGTVAALVAAFFWFWSSMITVPDNIDTFIGELQRISRLSSYGAIAAGVAAICGAIWFWFGPRLVS